MEFSRTSNIIASMYITHYALDAVLDTVQCAYHNLSGQMQLLSLCCRWGHKTLRACPVTLGHSALSILLRSCFQVQVENITESAFCKDVEGSVFRQPGSQGGIPSLRYSGARWLRDTSAICPYYLLGPFYPLLVLCQSKLSPRGGKIRKSRFVIFFLTFLPVCLPRHSHAYPKLLFCTILLLVAEPILFLWLNLQQC